jgi:hypothetical protein
MSLVGARRSQICAPLVAANRPCHGFVAPCSKAADSSSVMTIPATTATTVAACP